MDNKLAKQLKEAGFPQYPFAEGIRFKKLLMERPYKPDLSELIKACMDLLPKGGTLISGYCSDSKPPFGVSFNGQESAGGNTYEEAVAKLWLEVTISK